MTFRRALLPAMLLAWLLALLLAGCTRDTTGYTGPYEREVRRAIPQLEAATGLKIGRAHV